MFLLVIAQLTLLEHIHIRRLNMICRANSRLLKLYVAQQITRPFRSFKRDSGFLLCGFFLFVAGCSRISESGESESAVGDRRSQESMAVVILGGGGTGRGLMTAAGERLRSFLPLMASAPWSGPVSEQNCKQPQTKQPPHSRIEFWLEIEAKIPFKTLHLATTQIPLCTFSKTQLEVSLYDPVFLWHCRVGTSRSQALLI